MARTVYRFFSGLHGISIYYFFLGTVFNDYVGIFSYIGAAYILWMAWHMLRSAGVSDEGSSDMPSFRRGLFAGASMQKLFSSHGKTVDIMMAILLILCAVSLVWPH